MEGENPVFPGHRYNIGSDRGVRNQVEVLETVSGRKFQATRQRRHQRTRLSAATEFLVAGRGNRVVLGFRIATAGAAPYQAIGDRRQ